MGTLFMIFRRKHKKTEFGMVSFYNEEGFSLLLVLLFIGVISGTFTATFWRQSEQYINRQAYASGWHLVEVSKAARVFVRNASVNSVILNSGIQCCSQADVENQGGSIEIALADLVNAGHLSPLLDFENALEQNLRVFAASYTPVVDPLTQDLVVTSYVMTSAAVAGTRAAAVVSPRTAASLMLGARNAGMSASAPTIIGGVNLSDNCGADPAVMVWDTGCLTQDDVDIITASAGGLAVGDGQIIVPTWRVVDHDLRAMMRFPQPENPSANQMFTDLHFGDPTDFAANPDVAGVNNRVDMLNVRDAEMAQMSLENQGGPGSGGGDEDETALVFDAVAYNEMVLAVGGNVNNNGNLNLEVTFGADVGESVNVVGDIFVADSIAIEENLNITNTLTMNGDTVAMAIGGDAIFTGTATAFSEASFTSLDGGGIGVPVSDVDLQAGNGFAEADFFAQNVVGLDQIQANDSVVNVLNQLQMAGGTIDVVGGAAFAGGYDARFGSINQVSGAVNFNTANKPRLLGGGEFGPSTMTTLHTNICSGICPDETTNDGSDVVIP